MPDVFNPYATTFDQWLAPAAAARAAGLVEDTGGRWHVTPKGRELAARVRRAADEYLATLAPLPAQETARLASLLQRAYDAIAASGVPHDHMARVVRFVGDRAIPMVALENAVFALWQARDDSHMASWREAAFDGPTLDVLTRIWRREATTEEELGARLGGQRPADIHAAVGRLRSAGLVVRGALALSERGTSARSRIEAETDRRFFSPWPEDVARESVWIAERLARVNSSLRDAA